MSFLSRIFARPEPPKDRDITADVFRSVGLLSDGSVHAALSIPAVYAAVGGVSDTIATLPLPVLKADPDQGGVKDYGHPLYKLLNTQPNPVQTAKAYRASMVIDLLTEGEHTSEIVRNGLGEVVELWRIPRHAVSTQWDVYGRQLRFFVSGREIDANDLLHVVSFSLDGIRGVSPFSLCKDALTLASNMERFGSSFFKNSSRPGGFLTTPPQLRPEDRDAARKSWNEAFSGSDNAGKTPALPDGFAFNKISVDPEEGQFNESRQHQLTEMQRVCRVPPSAVYDFSRQTWNNIQYARLDYVANTIRPLVVAIEQEMQRKLLPGDTGHYVEHVLEGVLRGSFSEQVDALTKAVAGGIWTPNEARQKFDLPPVEGGDELKTATITPNGGNADGNPVDPNAAK